MNFSKNASGCKEPAKAPSSARPYDIASASEVGMNHVSFQVTPDLHMPQDSETLQAETLDQRFDMRRKMLQQIAMNTTLLPEELAEHIVSGIMPPTDQILMALLTSSMDTAAMTEGDPESTWNDKRLARQCLSLTFLAALGVVDKYCV